MSACAPEGTHGPHVALQKTDVDEDKCSTSSSEESHTVGVIDDTTLPFYERIIPKMMEICKELTLMLIFTIIYAALSQDLSPPKIGKAPLAYPFFNQSSNVKDYYRGDISRAVQDSAVSDIMFIMFYAPWDAECQEQRHTFEELAVAAGDSVFFAAINCWQPGSECRKFRNKVYKWPVYVAYTNNEKVVQYNGPKIISYMLRFLENIKMPYVRMTDLDNIYSLLSKYDALVVGTVQTKPVSKEFDTFYSVSLKFLEKDPMRTIGFALFSTKTDNTTVPLTVHLWNETLFYSTDDKFTTRAVVKWLDERVHTVTSWIDVSGVKSQQLSNYIEGGPAMFIFAPRFPNEDFNTHYSSIKRLALDYYNCDDNQRIIKLKEYLRVSNNSVSSVAGFGCKASNMTLQFIPLDSHLYHHFAERLGVDLSPQNNFTALAIVDERSESVYTHSGRLDDETINAFVLNFTKANLRRALLSSSYTTNIDVELSSSTFIPAVMEKNRYVVVAYYSKYCGQCIGMSHTFLTTIRKFNSTDKIRFYRIDGDVNTLPWEYTMDAYPRILFFPAKMKSESRVYPPELPITVPNLIGFVLANIEDAVNRVEVMRALCRSELRRNRAECHAQLRRETLNLIADHLRRWRRAGDSVREKAHAMRVLRKLKNLHLTFESYYDRRYVRDEL